MKRTYKITEEQYKRLCELSETALTGANSNGTETVVKTNKEGLSNGSAAKEALQSKAKKIEVTDTNNNSNNSVYESVITKKQLVSEARKEWKKGTKVVKMSELLKK